MLYAIFFSLYPYIQLSWISVIIKIMNPLTNYLCGGESKNGPTKLMLSLIPFCYMLMVAFPLVLSSPTNFRTAKRTSRENHLFYDDTLNILNDSFKPRSPKELNRLKMLHVPIAKDVRIWTHSLPTYFDAPVPAYSAPKLIYKEFFYNKRRKRELRTSRKISTSASSSYSSSKSSYYPFLMAEMVQGSVKTRHPSIIAVNGCPAYYIADHKGQCRQVFQYTVNFGQRSPKSHESPTPSPLLPQPIVHPVHSIFFDQPQQSPQISTEAPIKVEITPQPTPVQVFTPSRPTPSPRLLMLLRSAAKRFDFLKKESSSNSGETLNEEGIEKLRRKILSALKITKNKDYTKIEVQKTEKKVVVIDTKATTPDYDD